MDKSVWEGGETYLEKRVSEGVGQRSQRCAKYSSRSAQELCLHVELVQTNYTKYDTLNNTHLA